MSEQVRVWLVERTYSDDEQNLIILTYATTDGSQDLRKERALTSFSDHRQTQVCLTVDQSDLGEVADPKIREQYAREATTMQTKHDPDETI
jgi:hypothetical protein